MFVPQQPGSPQFVPPTAEQPYYQLKGRQQELSNQLESVADRREDLVREMQNAQSGVEREGLEARVKGLDQRILQIENDLATVGKELVASTPASLTYPDPIVRYRGFGEEDMFGAGFIGAGIMLALFMPFVIRNFLRRRRGTTNTTTQTPAVNNERMDRMEQAIDSIAVEMERVSENQRFMTRLLTETQLAGTIAAVRGSAEAAKAAAAAENSHG